MWNGNEEQSALIKQAIENGGLENIDAVKDAIHSTKAIAYTADIAKQASDRAIAALDGLPSSPYLDALRALARYSVERTH